MIVEPDFLEHWKTRLLVRLLGTEEAPLHVIRLWAHCQHRKTDRFTGWEPDVLASVCRWVGPAQTLWDSMLKSGFARVEKGEFIAHGWADCNASLVAAWANGKLGGRPKKAKENGDSDKDKKPPGNPSVIPPGTGRLSDREDREEKNPPIAPQGGEAQTPLQLESEPPPIPKPDPLAGFALFWLAYPKKTNQPTAKRAWLKLKPDADLARRIVEDVQARRNSFDWTKDAGQFIPNPGTYLNGRRWEDAVETLAPVTKPEPKTAAEHETKLGRSLTWAERQALEAGLSIA